MDDKIQQLKNTTRVLTMDAPSSQDVAEAFVEFLKVIQGIKVSLEEKLGNTSSDLANKVENVLYKVREIELSADKKITESRQSSLVDIKSISNQLQEEVKRLEGLMPEIRLYDQEIQELDRRVKALEEEEVSEVDFTPLEKKLLSEIELLRQQIPNPQRIADIERIAIANANAMAMPVTTAFYNGLRAKNLKINGTTAVQKGDTVEVTIPGLSSAGVQSVVAGSGISVDNSDPSNPVVSATGESSTGYQAATGTVDGSNKSFSFSVAPNAVVVDGVSMQKTAKDSTPNWTGTTSITLSVAPNFDIYAVG